MNRQKQLVLLVLAGIVVIGVCVPYSSGLLFKPYHNVFTVNYSSTVSFKNYTVATDKTTINLSGKITGILEATYHYYKDSVLVITRYKEYRLEGFDNPLSRQYITSLLHETVKHLYDLHEPPYPRTESFLLKGGLKYYVDPNVIESAPIMRQRITFIVPLHNVGLRILEDRTFKYDPSTGVLTETIISAEEGVNRPTSSYYLHLTLISSSTPSLSLETLSLETIILAVTPVFPAIPATYQVIVRRRRNAGISSASQASPKPSQDPPQPQV